VNFLLMRGLIREQRHWGKFPELLQERWPRAAILKLDLPGTGTEYQRECPATLAAITDDLRARFVEARADFDGPFTVVAVSLGGMVALDWCARHSSDFARAVVINSSAGDLSRVWERLDWKNYGTVLRGIATGDVGVRERCIIDMTINRSDFNRDELVERWSGYARDQPVKKSTLMRQLAAAARSKLDRRERAPTLVLASKADRLVRSICSERIATALSAPLELHDSGGHDLSFDAGGWVIDRVAAFVK
jgi:alpha-beta hydrolase superfamily lysophospholipase